MASNPPTISNLPATPDRADRPTFSARCVALFDALKNAFVSEANALAAWMKSTADEVQGNSSSAGNAAANAASYSGQSQDWATKISGPVSGGEYSAKYHAIAAAASAQTAILSPGTSATSSSSMTVGTGAKTLSIQAGKALVPGMWIIAADTAAPAINWMAGPIASYDSGTGALAFSAVSASGSGTKPAWNVSLTAAGGVASVNGKTGNVVLTAEDVGAATEEYVAQHAGGITLTASGAISAGQFVAAKSASSVVAVGIEAAAVSSKSSFGGSASVAVHKVVFDPGNNVAIIFYVDTSSNTGYAIVATMSESGPSFDGRTPASLGVILGNIDAVYDAGSGKTVALFRDSAGRVAAAVGTVASNDITFGAINLFNGSPECKQIVGVYDPVAQKIGIFFVQTGSGFDYGVQCVGTVSGTSLNVTSISQFNGSSYTQALCVAYDTAAGRIVAGWRKGQVGELSYLQTFTISGTSMSNGSAYSPGDYRVFPISIVYDSAAGCCLYSYMDQAAGNQYKVGRVVISAGSISSLSNVVNLPDAASQAVHVPSLSKTAFIYAAAGTGYGKISFASVSGGVISFDAASTYASEAISYAVAAYDSIGKRLSIAQRDSANHGFAVAFTPSRSNAARWVGVAKAAAVDGGSVGIATIGNAVDNQVGLVAGSDYYLSSTGALSTSASVGPKVGRALSTTKLLITGAA